MIKDTVLEKRILKLLKTLEQAVDAIGPTPLRRSLNEHVVKMRKELKEFDQHAYEELKPEHTNYLIGQRVIIHDKEIGTIVVSETGDTPFDIWVFSPSRGCACCFAFSSIKPLPGGQL